MKPRLRSLSKFDVSNFALAGPPKDAARTNLEGLGFRA